MIATYVAQTSWPCLHGLEAGATDTAYAPYLHFGHDSKRFIQLFKI